MLANAYSLDLGIPLNMTAKIWMNLVLFLNNNGGKLYYALLIFIIFAVLYLASRYRSSNTFYSLIAITNLVVICYLFFMIKTVFYHFNKYWFSH